MTHAANHNRDTNAPPGSDVLLNTCHLAESVARIARLPAAPTHDWCAVAAQALTPIAQGSIAGFVVANLNTDRTKLIPESTGVAPQSHPAALNLRTALERLDAIPFSASLDQLHDGLVTPITTILPDWSRLTERRASASTLAAIANVSTHDQPLIIIAIIDTPEHTSPPDPVHLGAALSVLARQASHALRSKTNSINWLTEREGLILERLILGHSVRVIAEELDRSPHTVHDHVKNLHRKLGATSRGQLIAVALGRAGPNNVDRDFIPRIPRETSPIAEIKPVQNVRST